VDGRHVGYQRTPGGGLRPTGNLARARAEAGIGTGFRHFNLFEHLTALENLIEASIPVCRRSPEQVAQSAYSCSPPSASPAQSERKVGDRKVREAVLKALTYPTTACKEGCVPPGAIN
jgi:ABC-type branched-subunit amino acid transport system ATPase component